MIEFTGFYYQVANTASQRVLVQFDGVLLHVWHLSDPFYRLLSSDVFHLSIGQSNGRRIVKLPNGARIETEDLEAIAALPQSSHRLLGNPLPNLLKHTASIALLTALIVALSAWLLSSNGLP